MVSNKIWKQLFIYFLVGGSAALVNWFVFYLLNNMLLIHYLVATAVAFIVATWVNWKLGRLSLFKNSELKSKKGGEIAQIYIVSGIGLVLNLVLMWIFVDKIGMIPLPSLILTTALVFAWNFLSRKVLIYKI
jgi:putative flippase GtrA